jgi:hypothetical protein
MPRVGFKATIPVFGRAKTFYALDRAATMIRVLQYRIHELKQIAEVFNSKISPIKTEAVVFKGKNPVTSKMLIKGKVPSCNYSGYSLPYN